MADVTRAEHVKRAVIGAVLSAAVIGAFSLVRVAVWEETPAAFAWLAESVPVARWWYGLLLLVAGGVVARLIGAAVLAARLPEHAAYTEDAFFGFVWRWKWGANGQAFDLQWYCPACDRLGVRDHDRFEQATTFFCSECQRPVRRPGPPDLMLNAVAREINLKVRNGRWKDIVEARKAASQPTETK